MGSYCITNQSILRAPGVRDKSDKVLRKGGLIECIDSIICNRDDLKESFYILDLDVVMSLYDEWTSNVPSIEPFFAVKCNPEKALLGALAALGSNFDCASKAEIETVLSLGVSPNRIIYANPCKAESHIKFAASNGVNLTTFDSLEELDKMHKWHPKCALLIRIKAPDDSKAKRPLGSKYGAFPMEVAPLLQAAKTLQLNVIGVSFHVGSVTTDGSPYIEAIAAAKMVFDTATQLGMPKMHVLDIGGGFVADSQFDQVATIVKAAIKTYFPNEPGLNVIAEPGRFFSETAFTLATKIIGKRIRDDLREYWINDGTYGSFNCVLRNTLSAPIKCMPLCCLYSNCTRLKTYNSTMFGPTCDSLDTVLTSYQLPELEVNDWLVFPNMGAYTTASGSSFNGFNTAAISTYLVTSI